MAMRANLGSGYGVVLIMAMAMVGCGGPSEDPETLAMRSKYLAVAELADPLSLTKAATLVGVGGEPDSSKQTTSEVASQGNASLKEASPGDAGDAAEIAKREVKDVTVIGRIHAGELEPWESGKASFMLSEVPEDGHGEGHDADNCPFCKRRLAKAPTAVVKFVDAQGQTLPIDSRKLFGLEKDQKVMVRGTVVAGDFNSIVLVADQMHILKP